MRVFSLYVLQFTSLASTFSPPEQIRAAFMLVESDVSSASRSTDALRIRTWQWQWTKTGTLKLTRC